MEISPWTISLLNMFRAIPVTILMVSELSTTCIPENRKRTSILFSEFIVSNVEIVKPTYQIHSIYFFVRKLTNGRLRVIKLKNRYPIEDVPS